MALRPNAVAAKENQPYAQAFVQDEAWPGANAKRRPIGRYTVKLSTSTASVQQHRLIKERLRCHHVQLKVVETTMGRKEQRERERKKAAKGSCGVERVRLFAKKAIVVRRCPERDGDESAAARGRGQLFAIVPPATRTRRRKLFPVVFSDSSEC